MVQKQVENVVNPKEDKILVGVGIKNEEGSSTSAEYFKETYIDDIKVMIYKRVDDLKHDLL